MTLLPRSFGYSSTRILVGAQPLIGAGVRASAANMKQNRSYSCLVQFHSHQLTWNLRLGGSWKTNVLLKGPRRQVPCELLGQLLWRLAKVRSHRVRPLDFKSFACSHVGVSLLRLPILASKFSSDQAKPTILTFPLF